MRTLAKTPVPAPFSSPEPVAPRPELSVVGMQMRTMPRQQRARDAVSRVLAATAAVLDESGFDALTTTAVAERAGVNIATLYRYFPDKFSLVQALAVSLEAERAVQIDRMLETFATTDNWRGALRTILDSAIDLRLKKPGARGLRRALHSAPQLWVIEREGAERSVQRYARAIRKRVPGLSARRAESIGRTTVVLLVGLLDWVMAEPTQRRAVGREGMLALERYLADYLD